MAFRTAPLSSGRRVPRVTIGRVTSFTPVRDLTSTTRYCRLFNATTAYTSVCTDAGVALGTRVYHLQSPRRLWPDTRRLKMPLDDCCRRVLPYNPNTAFNRRNRSLMTLPRWGQKVLLLAIIPVPQRSQN